jgi:hypothetical protein
MDRQLIAAKQMFNLGLPQIEGFERAWLQPCRKKANEMPGFSP